ncbi:hypothetical protein BAE44_0015805 [Dichanthelium oligosanthes]|uniref:Transmembrane protein n=1 Tax=Dichanthelium oligosanthes TaxID=888268 RepID=A0A1E5VDF1_9POAL|nr:hypothetical protein BAE44_0015805 [Dichanthelium oligosanthes]
MAIPSKTAAAVFMLLLISTTCFVQLPVPTRARKLEVRAPIISTHHYPRTGRSVLQVPAANKETDSTTSPGHAIAPAMAMAVLRTYETICSYSLHLSSLPQVYLYPSIQNLCRVCCFRAFVCACVCVCVLGLELLCVFALLKLMASRCCLINLYVPHVVKVAPFYK